MESTYSEHIGGSPGSGPSFLVGALSYQRKMPDYSSDLFFSRRFSIKGKMPDYSSDLFFLQTTILTLIGPLFTILSRVPEAKSAQGKLDSKGSPLSFFTFSRKHTKPDVPKGSPLWIFFGTVRLFFRNFFVSKGSPLWIFSALCNYFSKMSPL